MKTEELYALQTSGSDMLFSTSGGIDVASFTNMMSPMSLLLVVSLCMVLCYGLYRRSKWSANGFE